MAGFVPAGQQLRRLPPVGPETCTKHDRVLTHLLLTSTGLLMEVTMLQRATRLGFKRDLEFAMDRSDCQLAKRIVQILPAVMNTLPPCIIRQECRWYSQEGSAACRRCPEITTVNYDVSPTYLLRKRGTKGNACGHCTHSVPTHDGNQNGLRSIAANQLSRCSFLAVAPHPTESLGCRKCYPLDPEQETGWLQRQLLDRYLFRQLLGIDDSCFFSSP